MNHISNLGLLDSHKKWTALIRVAKYWQTTSIHKYWHEYSCGKYRNRLLYAPSTEYPYDGNRKWHDSQHLWGVAWLTWWEELSIDDSNLHLLAADANETVNGEEDERPQEEEMSEGRLDQTSCSVQNHQDEEDDVGVVSVPEGFEGVASGVLHGKDVDHKEVDGQQHAGHSWSKKEAHEYSLGAALKMNYTGALFIQAPPLSGNLLGCTLKEFTWRNWIILIRYMCHSLQVGCSWREGIWITAVEIVRLYCKFT